MIKDAFRDALRDRMIYSKPLNGDHANLGYVMVGAEALGGVMGFKRCDAIVEWLRSLQAGHSVPRPIDDY